MSQSRTARLARNSTGWLLLLLCTVLLAWRIDFRIEQYHLSSVATPTAVAFFDANERNIATLDETHFSLGARFVQEHPHFLADADHPAALAVQLTETSRRRPETPPVLSGSLVHSVPLFPNPPPASFA
jgi:hypothetical protein